jgi:hypothetical protein
VFLVFLFFSHSSLQKQHISHTKISLPNIIIFEQEIDMCEFLLRRHFLWQQAVADWRQISSARRLVGESLASHATHSQQRRR